MAHSLKLEVLLAAVDKATAPLKRIDKATKAAAQAMRSTRKELRDLNKTQSDVEAYQRADIAIKHSAQALKALQQQTDKMAEAHSRAKTKQNELKAEMTSAQRQFERLANAMKSAGSHSSTLSNEMDKTRLRMDQIRSAQAKASDEVQKHSRRLRSLGEQESRTRYKTEEANRTVEIVGQRLREAGHDMQHLDHQSRLLSQNENRLNDTLKTQRERLEKLRVEQDKATASREKFERVRNGAAVGGAVGVAAGGAALYGGYQTIDDAKHFDLEKNRLGSLGIGKEMTERLTKYATEMEGFGTSQLERMELMRDAMSVLGDEHHAKEVMPLLTKMKFANKALYGDAQAGEMDKKFLDMLKVVELRGGLKDPAEFAKQANMIQQVITATGGRVDATEYMHVIQRGGLAAKGIEDRGFYYELEPIVQEMGGDAVGNAMMSGYQNLYQGKTTKAAAKQLAKLGLIGNKGAIQYDKAGQQAFLGPGALLKGELFRTNQIEWVRTVLIPQLKKKGITQEKDIQNAIGAIISNRTAANLYSTFVQQIGNGSIARSMKVNENAENIDQAEARARDTAQGKEEEALARRHDLMQQLGTQLMPLYLDMLNKVNKALTTFSRFLGNHPVLARRAMKGLMAFGAVAVVLGGLSIAFSALSGPIMLVGKCLSFLFLLVMANPIMALLTGIAITAILIYKYWEPIKKWFASIGIDLSWLEKLATNMWTKIKTAFGDGLGGILLLIAEWSPIGLAVKMGNALLDYMGIKMPDYLVNAGLKLKQKFIDMFSWNAIGNHIRSFFHAIKEAFNGNLLELGKMLWDWSPIGILINIFNGMKATLHELIWEDNNSNDLIGGGLSAVTNVLVNKDARDSLINGAQQYVTKGSQLENKAAGAVGHVINIAVHGGGKDSAQEIGHEVKRQLQNAMDQLTARGRSGMADRG